MKANAPLFDNLPLNEHTTVVSAENLALKEWQLYKHRPIDRYNRKQSTAKSVTEADERQEKNRPRHTTLSPFAPLGVPDHAPPTLTPCKSASCQNKP